MRNPIFNTTHFVRVQVRRHEPKDYAQVPLFNSLKIIFFLA